MKEKVVAYGTTHPVTVLSASEHLIAVRADEINEGFLLMGHGVKKLPKEGDKGKIVFTWNNRSGYWAWHPEKSN